MLTASELQSLKAHLLDLVVHTELLVEALDDAAPSPASLAIARYALARFNTANMFARREVGALAVRIHETAAGGAQ